MRTTWKYIHRHPRAGVVVWLLPCRQTSACRCHDVCTVCSSQHSFALHTPTGFSFSGTSKYISSMCLNGSRSWNFRYFFSVAPGLLWRPPSWPLRSHLRHHSCVLIFRGLKDSCALHAQACFTPTQKSHQPPHPHNPCAL